MKYRFKFRRFIRNEIKPGYVEKYLKSCNISIPSKEKSTITFFEKCVNDDQSNLSIENAEEVIKNSIKYGERRFLYISKFKKHDSTKMANHDHIMDSLKKLDTTLNVQGNFNDLNSEVNNQLKGNKTNKLKIEYLDIQKDEKNQKVIGVEIGLAEFTKNINPNTGVSVDSKNYIWIEIIIPKNTICFRIPSSAMYFGKAIQADQQFSNILEDIQKAFGINYEDMTEYKEDLYAMAKDIFEVAERPFSKRFKETDELYERIKGLVKRKEPFNDLDSYELFAGRLQDLIERVIIQENFIDYMNPAEGKEGVITKIEFTDSTGASVKANAGTKKDGNFEQCEIFFDTRKTLSDESNIDQILIDWFIPESISHHKRVTCRFFVGARFLGVNFQYIQLSKEVEDYVFSKLRKYRGFNWHRQ